MRLASYADKALVTQILSHAFRENKGVNYILKQDGRKAERLHSLMDYSFEVCYRFGAVYLSEDRKACALIVFPEKKKTSLSSMMLDIKLIFSATGVGNVMKTVKREAAIKKHHPPGLLYYLWFIGVDPKEQRKGIGSALLQEVIAEGLSQNRKICLETSTLENVPWYEKSGFSIYRELDFGYKLFCMKREP